MVDWGGLWKIQVQSVRTGQYTTFQNGDGILSYVQYTTQSDGIPFFECSIINDNGVFNNQFVIGDLVTIWLDPYGENNLVGVTKRFYGFIKTVGVLREGTNNNIVLKGFGYLDKFKRTIVHELYKGYRTYEDILTNPNDGLLKKYLPEISGDRVATTGKSITLHETFILNYVSFYEVLSRFRDLMGDWYFEVLPNKVLVFEPCGTIDQVKTISTFDDVYFESTDEYLVNSLYVMGGEDFTALDKTNWVGTASHNNTYAPYAYNGTPYSGRKSVIHITDVYVKAAINHRTHTTNAYITLRTPKNHSTDTCISGKGSIKTHATDTAIHLGTIRTHFSDLFVKATQAKTHTTNSIINVRYTKTHTTNTYIRTTKFHKTDTCVKVLSQLHKTHTTNTYIAVPGGGTADYYVSTSGNDNNPGTQASPWRTIQKAANTLTTGQVCFIRGGTYGEKIYINKNGSSGNEIVFSAYPGETVTIDGSSAPSVGFDEGLVNITGSYIQFKNCKIINSGWAGIRVINGNHITIQGNNISYTYSSGVLAAAGSNYNILSNTLYRTSGYYCGNGQSQESISIQAGVDGFECAYNSLTEPGFYGGCGAEGIDAKTGTKNGTIHHNSVVSAGSVSIYVDGFNSYANNIDVYCNYVNGGSAGIAISSESGGGSDDVCIFNNIIINSQVGIRLPAYDDGSGGSITNAQVINNTIYSNGWNVGGGGIWIGQYAATHINGLIIRNNILSQNGSWQIQWSNSGSHQNVSIDHNLFDGNGGVVGSSYATGSPRFVNPGTDFHLQSLSPAIDIGSSTNAPSTDYDGNSRPYGSGYDMGAYEYGSSGGGGGGGGGTNILNNPGFEDGSSGSTVSIIPTPTPLGTGTVYYVSTSGDDNYPGTLSQPWRTIQKAANTLTAGQTVYVRAGTYYERVFPQNSGTAGQPITYKNYGTESVTISCQGISIPNFWEGMVDILGKNYIIFDGFRFDGSNGGGGIRMDVGGGVPCTHITIRNNTLIGSFYFSPIRAGYYSGCDYIDIYNNHIENSGSNPSDWVEQISLCRTFHFNIYSNYIKNTGSAHIVAIDCSGGCQYGNIFCNYVDMTEQVSVGIYLDARDTITDINIYNNECVNCNGAVEMANEAYGDVDGTATIQNVYIYNNLLHDSQIGIWIAGFQLSYNAGTITNIHITNNTLVNNTYRNLDAGQTSDTTTSNLYIRNNIFYGKAVYFYPNVTGITLDYNCYYNSPITGASDPHAVNGDPLFVNLATKDYHLQSSSPCKDHGQSTDAPGYDYETYTRPLGGLYDIGAYEYHSTGVSNWRLITQSGNTPTWATDAYHSGTKSIKISVPGTTDVISGEVWSDYYAAEVGKNYTVGGYIKSNGVGGTNPPAIRAAEYDSSYTFLRQTSVYFPQGTADWTYNSVTFTTGANTAYIAVYANIWNGYGTIWVDDVSLVDPENLILNPGFEDGNIPIQDWKLYPNGSSVPKWDDAVYYSAPTSVKISIPGTSDVVSGWLQSDYKSEIPNEQYLVEVYGKGAGLGGSSAPSLQINEYDINKTFLRANYLYFSQGTYDWTHYSASFTTGANTAYITVVVKINGGYGTFWVDDLYYSRIEMMQGNPTFELGSGNVPDLWQFNTQNGNTPIWDNTVSHYQSRSVKISIPGTADVISGSLSGVYPYMPGGGGATFHVTAWGKGEGLGGTNPPAVRLYEFDENYNYLRNTAIYFPQGTYDWTFREMYITSGNDCDHIAIFVDIYDGYGTFWVDDLYLYGSMNVIANPTLDSGLPTVPNWSLIPSGMNIPIIDPTVSYSGVRSAKFYIGGISDDNSGSLYYNTYISTAPNRFYSFSAYGKGEGLGGSNPPKIHITEYDANMVYLRENVIIFPQGTYGWTWCGLVFGIGANTAYLNVYVSIENGYGTFWVDDFSLLYLRDLYDGTTTGWMTGTDQVTDMWYLLDIGSPQVVARMLVDSTVVLWGATTTVFYPRSFKIEASKDNVDWSSIYLQDTNTDTLLVADFPQDSYRYFKITLTAPCGGYWWGIGSLELFNKYTVVTRRDDSASIAEYGKYEEIIRDTTLGTKQQVIQRGKAELAKRKEPIITGTIELAYFFDATPNELLTVYIPGTPYNQKFMVDKVTFYEDTWGSFKETITVRSK